MNLHRRLRKLEEHARVTAPEPEGPLTIMELARRDRPAVRALMDRALLAEALSPEELARHPDYARLWQVVAERWEKFQAAGRPKEGLPDQDEVMRATPEVDWTLDGAPIDRLAKWRNPRPTTVRSAGGAATPQDRPGVAR